MSLGSFWRRKSSDFCIASFSTMGDTSHPILPYIARLSHLVLLHQQNEFKSDLTTNELPTPSHLADFGRILKNCDQMLLRAQERSVSLRPHVKTHKTIEGALLQLYGSGITKLTLEEFKKTSKVVVSTIGEVKFFAEHGFCDILFASPIVHSKMDRIDAILDGIDERSDIHSGMLMKRLKEGEIKGVCFGKDHDASIPFHSSLSNHSRMPKTPREMGVSVAVMIDSIYGFDVVKRRVLEMMIERMIEMKKNDSSSSSSSYKLRIWIDIDGGYHRTGMNYSEDHSIGSLLDHISSFFSSKSKTDSSNSSSSSNSSNHPNDFIDSLFNAHPSLSKSSFKMTSSEFKLLYNDLFMNSEINRNDILSFSSFASLDGLYYHGGNSYGSKTIEEIESYAIQEVDAVRGMNDLCLERGMKFPSLAVGSTPTCSKPPKSLHPINELHPGNYIFYDGWQSLIGSCDWSNNASFVLSQVLSSYSNPDRVAFDAGALALSKDLGATHIRDMIEMERIKNDNGNGGGNNGGNDGNNCGNNGNEKSSSSSEGPMSSHPIAPSSSSFSAPIEFGTLSIHSDSLYISRITQEMGIIQVRPHLLKNHSNSSSSSSGSSHPSIKAHLLLPPSTRFRIIPNHSCLSAACFPTLFIVHQDLVIDEWFTAPRIW